MVHSSGQQIEENGVTNPRKYFELTHVDSIQADCDVKATNILLQGLPPEIYVLVSNHRIAKELWEIIQFLMQGTSLTKQEREYPLALVATHQMTRSPYQTHQNSYQNSKFQLQVSLYQSPQYGSPYQYQQYSNNQSSTSLLITYPSNDYQSLVNHNVYSPPSSISQIEYALTVNQLQSEFPQLDLGLTVPVFKQGDDLIDAINHMMSFLSAVITSCYLTTNNQLRNSPTKVEVPKELPKVSMVNTSLNKLKHHLAGFDVAVEQHCLESKTFEVKMNKVLNEKERLLEQVISKDIVNIIVNSSVDNASVNVHECEKCLKLETELLNKTDFIEKEIYDKLFRSYTTLEKHCISLEVDTQLNKEIFQRDNSVSNQSAPSFD
ncbi:hypothetical protein Tco_1546276 [Tanacetum coccineum]